MQEKLKGVGEKLKSFFTKINKKTRIVLAVTGGIIVIVSVVIALILNNRPYTVLFTGLSSEEVSSIITYLSDKGVTDYQVQGNDTILVPESQESQLKADLLMEGYPTSGFAYETYRAGVGSMSTDSDRQIAYLQDLQDRMAGVIRCLNGVQNAVVTIAQGEDRRYILDSDNVIDASASVMVTMAGGAKLSSQQASAIRNLVAHGVKGLNIDDVAISDSQGNVYSADDINGGSADASQLKLQLEEQVNNKVRTQVMAVLTPLYGEDNVRVAVSSMVDVSHTVGESTQYTQPDWAADGSTNGEGIIGSKVYDQEIIRGSDQTNGGAAGNDSNADISTYVENSAKVNGNETYTKNQGQTDYNVNTDKTQVERVAGTVTDLMVSVSINSTTAGNVNAADLLSHVARAAGISPDQQADKISILQAPFYTQQNEPTTVPVAGLNLPNWAIYAAIGGAALLIILLVLILILHKRRSKRKRAELENMISAIPQPVAVGAPSADTGADIMNIKTEKSIQLRQEIRKFAEENPEIAAQMLKNWLKGGEEDG